MIYTSDFDYNLPGELIAQQPVKPRDHSRLLILDKKTGQIEHRHFFDIVNYLCLGDVLVLNNSKVFPARLIGRKKNTGGKIEIFLHQNPPLSLPLKKGERKERGEIWNCLLGGHGRKEGLEVKFRSGLEAKVFKNNYDGTWQVKFNKSGQIFFNAIDKIGRTPLPPYIKRKKEFQSDKVCYQTVYADGKKVGSVAAPTAGFHFTPALIKKIKNKGVQIEYVTLHVGLGTFAPVKVKKIKDHQMHSELVEVHKRVIDNIKQAKKEKRRIIAVGTTAARTLESVFAAQRYKQKFWTDIFIYPPYKFKAVDAMITNFHLPQSTLLMLVSAFAGKKNIDQAYREAIKNKYRFYSYGDAMLIY